MWYSILKTGDERIDLQHANIDTLLSLMRPGHPELARNFHLLILAAERHFESEQTISEQNGYHMSDEHIARHQEIVVKLLELESTVAAEDEDVDLILAEAKNLFTTHAIKYDRSIVPRDLK